MRFVDTIYNIIRGLCVSAAVALILVSVLVYHADFRGLLLFALYILAYVHFPGRFILRVLKVRTGHISSDLMLSFFTGWALTVALYFVSAYSGVSLILYGCGPVLTVLYLIPAIRDGSVRQSVRSFSFTRIPLGLFFSALLIMLYVFLNTQFLYMDPGHCDNIYASIDKCYQMGLISSLTKGYPLVNPWVADRLVYYHIFSQILLSVPVSLLGLKVDFIVMSCCPYLSVYLLSTTLYSMFRYFCRRKDLAGVYTLSVVLSHMFIARAISASYLFRIIFVNDNYGGFALAGAVIVVIMLDIFCRSEGEGKAMQAARLALLVVLMMLLTGIKAPVGLVMTGGLIGTALLGLILRKTGKREIIAAAVTALGFVSVYKFLLSSDATAGVGGSSIFFFGNLTGLCFWKQSLIEYLTNHGIPPFIRLLCILACFAAAFFTAYLLPFAVGYLRELVLVLSGRKDYDFARVTVYAASIVGAVMMMFLRYSGHSQIYFGVVLVAFCPLISFWFFEDMNRDTAVWMKAVAGLCGCVMCVSLVFTSYTLYTAYRNMIPEAVRHTDPASEYGDYSSLSAEEYDAVMWIRDNTEEDSLFATQMYASAPPEDYDYTMRWHNVHFLYAAYSGRNFYLEGSGFALTDEESGLRLKMIKNTDALYDVQNDARGDLARELGVDYVMVTQKLHPTEDLSSDDYTRVFANQDIEIYKVAAE